MTTTPQRFTKEHVDCRDAADRMIALRWFYPGDEWPLWESFAEMRDELATLAKLAAEPA